MVMHAIPTLYTGVWFRSRLEARWAAFLDALKLRWVYEPCQLGAYIPDFLVWRPGSGYLPLYVEVKPAATREGLLNHPDAHRLGMLADSIDDAHFAMVGVDPSITIARNWAPDGVPPHASLSPAAWDSEVSIEWNDANPYWGAGADYNGGYLDEWASACNATQWRKVAKG